MRTRKKPETFENGQIDIPGERKFLYCIARFFHSQTPIKWLEMEEALPGTIRQSSSFQSQGDFQEGCLKFLSAMKKEHFFGSTNRMELF